MSEIGCNRKQAAIITEQCRFKIKALHYGGRLSNQIALFVQDAIGSIDSSQPQQLEERDVHSSHMDIVDLLDWEQTSLHGLLDTNVTMRSAMNTCRVPDGVSNICCLGSFSNGGGTTVIHRHRCAKPLRNLDQVREHTHQWFQQNPINDDSAMACDICQIVELARRRNLTIALIGDSMHNQIYDGLSCELERRHYQINKTSIDLNPTKETSYIYRRYSQMEIINIRSPTWPPEQTSVTIQFHRVYMLPLVNNDMEALTAQADVVVLGFGLHYWYDNTTGHIFKRQNQYIEAMKDLFQNVTNQGHVQLLVHRETSAQHFDADGGEFILW